MISLEAVSGVSAQSIRMLQIPKIFLIMRSIVDWFSERFPIARARRSAERRSVGHDPRKTESRTARNTRSITNINVGY